MAMLGGLLGAIGPETVVVPPFFCDYGANIRLGADCFINTNTIFLDCAEIRSAITASSAPACRSSPPTIRASRSCAWPTSSWRGRSRSARTAGSGPGRSSVRGSRRRPLGGRGRQRRHQGRPRAGRRRRQSLPRDPPAQGRLACGLLELREADAAGLDDRIGGERLELVFSRRGLDATAATAVALAAAGADAAAPAAVALAVLAAVLAAAVASAAGASAADPSPGSAACRRSSPDAPDGCRSGSRRDGGGCRGRGRRRRCSRPSGTARSDRPAAARRAWRACEISFQRTALARRSGRCPGRGRSDARRWRRGRVLGEAVGDEDVVACVRYLMSVSSRRSTFSPGKPGIGTNLPPPGRLAEVLVDLVAAHRAVGRSGQRGEGEGRGGRRNEALDASGTHTCPSESRIDRADP